MGFFYHGRVLERIKEEWRRFAAEPPGERFERHYERKRAQEAGLVGRLMWIVAGVLFLLAGIVMLFTPGPGLLSIGFGVTCLSRESRSLSRGCDRAELRIRAAWARWRARKR
jgi:hypothetical protein